MICRGNAEEVAEQICDLIQDHEDDNDVHGRHSDKPHLYHNEVYQDGETWVAHLWSTQGLPIVGHDCWIKAFVVQHGPLMSEVSWDHCGDDGVRRIISRVQNDLS